MSSPLSPQPNGATALFDETELAPTRAPLEAARHLPGHYYTSQEVYDLEVEKLFMRDWLMIARVEEFAEPGDYMTFEIVGEPIVVCLNDRRELQAFANVCKHRGAAIAKGNGNAKEFSCPFHGWIYDLDGHLVAPSQPKGLPHFDVKACRLSPIRLETWGGFAFVTFNDGTPSLAEYLAVDEFAESAAFMRPQDMQLFDRFTYGHLEKFLPSFLIG